MSEFDERTEQHCNEIIDAESKRECLCGRIITDINSKTGLCPKCQKGAYGIATGLGWTGIFIGVKKFNPKFVKGVMNVIKNEKWGDDNGSFV